MNIRRLFQISTAASFLVLSSGSALADDLVISNTGPGSDTSVSQSTDNSMVVENTNTVNASTTNNQTAATGSAEVASNTTGGDATSGGATNNFVATTTVMIDNTPAPVDPGGGGGGGGGDNGNGNGNGTGGSGSGGDVLGASTGGLGGGGDVATLPEVGAKYPVDVSYLRNLYHPNLGSTAGVAGQAKSTSAVMFLIAFLLAGMAGIGAYVSGKRTTPV